MKNNMSSEDTIGKAYLAQRILKFYSYYFEPCLKRMMLKVLKLDTICSLIFNILKEDTKKAIQYI